jgi:hypothetical protein
VPPANVDSAGIAKIGTGLNTNYVPMIMHQSNSVIGRTIIDNDNSQCKISGRDWQRVQYVSDIASAIVGDYDDGAVNVARLI